MRHRKKGKKIGTSQSHKKAILMNLAAEIFKYGKVKTTQVRAKEVRPLVDKIVSLAKKGDVHARRQVLSMLGSRELTHQIFSEVAPKYEERNGGYTRLLKVGFRKGDAAPLVIIELV